MDKRDATCEMLDVLASELYNEIFIQLGGYWDEKTSNLGDAIIKAVKSTREKLYGSEEDTP